MNILPVLLLHIFASKISRETIFVCWSLWYITIVIYIKWFPNYELACNCNI